MRQFSETIANEANRGMWYVVLRFRFSTKSKWTLKSPLRPLDGGGHYYETKAQAEREVVHHRMLLEGHFEMRGGLWYDTRPVRTGVEAVTNAPSPDEAAGPAPHLRGQASAADALGEAATPAPPSPLCEAGGPSPTSPLGEAAIDFDEDAAEDFTYDFDDKDDGIMETWWATRLYGEPATAQVPLSPASIIPGSRRLVRATAGSASKRPRVGVCTDPPVRTSRV